MKQIYTLTVETNEAFETVATVEADYTLDALNAIVAQIAQRISAQYDETLERALSDLTAMRFRFNELSNTFSTRLN